jgi:hypothetical protein
MERSGIVVNRNQIFENSWDSTRMDVLFNLGVKNVRED